MYTLATANEKTSIAVLKSDIFQVHLRLQKMKNLLNKGQRPQSRRRSEIAAIQKGTSEVEEVIKSFPSDDINRLKYQLALLLNEKMIELESTVFKLTSNQRDTSQTPSMSRLPVWLKLLDRHVEMCNPEGLSRPASRSNLYQQPKTVRFDPVQSLLKQYSVNCAVRPSSPEFLTAAVAALGAKMQEQLEKIEELAKNAENIKSMSKQKFPTGEVYTHESSKQNDLIAAEQNVDRLNSRMDELVEVTNSVRQSLTKEINKLQNELIACKAMNKK